MTNKQKYSILGVTAIAGVIALGSLTTLWTVQAADTTYPAIVEKIANAFNLDKDKVQAVFETERTERQAERLSTLQTRLDTLVKDGKLTSAQKDKYLELLAKIDAKRDEIRQSGAQPLARHEEMEALVTQLQNWITDQKLGGVLSYGMGRGRMFGGLRR